MKNILVILSISIFISGCITRFNSDNTVEVIRLIQKQLPQEYHYLIAKDGDGLEVLRWKLKQTLKELSRVEAKNKGAISSAETLLEQLEDSNTLDLW